jgi:cation diffusion facilitator family transporter
MITEWLVRRYAGPGDPRADARTRARAGLVGGWVSIVLNLVLFVVKAALGAITGSIAVIADAVHSLSDVVSSAVVVFGFRMASKPSDEEHPFGHGRAETIATLIVAVLLIVIGVEFIRTSIGRLMNPVALVIGWPMIAALAATIVVKEWLTRFSMALGRLIGSDALEADAWHHRTDSISTLLVLVGFVLSRFGLTWVDGVAGIAVSAIVIWTGFEIGRRAVNRLLGQAPTEEEVEEIHRTAMGVEGVEGVHEVIIHRYGDRRAISLHVEVSAERPALELHSIADEVEERLSQGQRGVVVVHIDPIDRDHPHYDRVSGIIGDVVGADSRCHSFHDLRIVGTESKFHVLFDLAVHQPLDAREDGELAAKVTEKIQESFPGTRVVICVEPAFVRSS